MKKTKLTFAQSAHATAIITVITLLGLAVAGWVMNIYKLIIHLPATDFETLIRIAGIPLAPVGALLGYFL